MKDRDNVHKVGISNILNNIKQSILKENGLSLIEMAIGLVVLGLIIMPIIQSQKYNVVKEMRQVNYGAIQNSIDGINQYFESGNGAYPCPASLTLGEGNTGFGLSGDCTLTNVKLCTDLSWPATEGICKTSNSSDAIIIGGIPFSSLGMPQEEALDYWGNKLIYAVTQTQTNNTTYATGAGQIRIMGVDNPVLVAQSLEDGIPNQISGLYDLFVFSTGYNGTGGYTKDGNAITACGSASSGYESENCNFDNVFFIDRNPDNDSSGRSEASGAAYFDDWTTAQKSLPISTWFKNENNMNYVMTLATRVGVGTTDPDYALDVAGSIRTQSTGGGSPDGNIITADICNDTSDCFSPNLVSAPSAVPSMDCRDLTTGINRVVTAIGDSAVTCDTVLDVPPATFSDQNCAALGKSAIGIDASGGLICAP